MAGTAAGGAAAADDGLDESGHGRYVLDADETAVDVTITSTIRNTTPDKGSYYYFFTSYGIPVPAGAQDLRATSGGATLSVSRSGGDDPSIDMAVATFPALRYGRERTIEWTFTIPGEKVRSADYTRVGPGYATFAVQAPGDKGETSVELVLPSAMTFNSSVEMTATKDGDSTTYTTDDGTDGFGTWVVVSARDPEQVDEREVRVDGTTLTLHSFPGDKRWTSFVEKSLTEGLPALEEAVGTPWPGGLDVIREDVSPQVLGYAWFDSSADEIVVPEDLDPTLLYHELGHAWLNPDALTGRWLSEGLTEVVARRVVHQTGAKESKPPAAPDRKSDAAVPLTAWGAWEGDPYTDAEEYGYDASYTAVSTLLDDLDDETFAAVVAAALRGESAYEEPGSDQQLAPRTGWKRFLDLVEERGGVENAGKVYKTWVLDAEERTTLTARADAREAYAALDEADGAWRPPVAARSAMAGWHFTRAERLFDQVGGAAALAGDLQTTAEAAGLEVPASVRSAYEDAMQADDLTALDGLLGKATSAVTAVGAARDAASEGRGPLPGLGAVILDLEDTADDAVSQLEAGDLALAAELAGDVETRSGWATGVGAGTVALVLLLLAGLAVLGAGAARRRRRARVRP
ncbi:hypothetical protein LEP48_09840 [Isoptericola sp. NEAU-Y5]|uniref:Peptidase M1 membrane alanine aminopeptidase n=1 Tax=Isoptericola luteus TaxID=2879484 RepID=A0ABS7ZF26_9MICO|nr:hypothetical protein [Isoptericola sp. NEAU-Y5]MCA5893648.1 hypothetical protein [Isoptericola sp. NEAU-Y5]